MKSSHAWIMLQGYNYNNTSNGSGTLSRTTNVFGKTFPIAMWHAVTSDRDLVCKVNENTKEIQIVFSLLFLCGSVHRVRTVKNGPAR